MPGCICAGSPAWDAPKLDIEAINETLGLLDCFGIVNANQRLKAVQMTVVPNDVSPVLDHPEIPCSDGAEIIGPRSRLKLNLTGKSN
jgi:hypothetical protein